MNTHTQTAEERIDAYRLSFAKQLLQVSVNIEKAMDELIPETKLPMDDELNIYSGLIKMQEHVEQAARRLANEQELQFLVKEIH